MEAKAARIKDWVTNKLKELEEQNQHLREQNVHCNEQMDLLRTRLDQLQELGQTCHSKTTSRRESAAEVRGRVVLATSRLGIIRPGPICLTET